MPTTFRKGDSLVWDELFALRPTLERIVVEIDDLTFYFSDSTSPGEPFTYLEFQGEFRDAAESAWDRWEDSEQAPDE